jgi:hypothetical protein
MKKVLYFSLITLIVLALGLPFAFAAQSIVGDWVHCEDSSQVLHFGADGSYEAHFSHTLGWIDVTGEYWVTNGNPMKVTYSISNIYIDKKLSTADPGPGDEINGIWKIDGNKLTIHIADDPWDPFPPANELASEGTCYNKK